MNLIDGIIIPHKNGSLFKGAGLTVALTGYLPSKKGEVTLGVRPEGIVLNDQTIEDGFGTISSIELLGDKNQIYLTIEQERPIVSVTSPKLRFEIEERVKIKLKEDGILLFDTVNGRRLYP